MMTLKELEKPTAQVREAVYRITLAQILPKAQLYGRGQEEIHPFWRHG